MSEDKWTQLIVEFRERTALKDSYLISLWGNIFIDAVTSRLRGKIDVSRDEFNVLFTLAGRGPTLARDVGALNHRPKNSISRAVSSLLERGCITRTPTEEDRRKELLSLTDAGQALYDAAEPLFLEGEAELLGALSQEEIDQLNGLLLKALVGRGAVQ